MAHHMVLGHDNRGSDDHPFGYVYFGPHKKGPEAGRVGYGSHRDNRSALAIWPCRDTPHDISPLTIQSIHAYLRKAYPNLVDVVFPEPAKTEQAA